MTNRVLTNALQRIVRDVFKKPSGRRSNKQQSYYFIVVVVAISIFLMQNPSFTNTLASTQPGLYRVVSVSDGDTIVVDMNGEDQTIRFIGIDTPETHHPSKPVQCFGKEASRFTAGLLENKEVRLEADPESDNRDRYARLLRYVYLPDGTNVNAEVVAQGYGFAPLAFPHSKLTEFQILEESARQQQRGLWKACDQEVNEYGSLESRPAEE